jgi:hypothetical protein
MTADTVSPVYVIRILFCIIVILAIIAISLVIVIPCPCLCWLDTAPVDDALIHSRLVLLNLWFAVP